VERLARCFDLFEVDSGVAPQAKIKLMPFHRFFSPRRRVGRAPGG
jgi:hypothetical protein